MTYRTAYRQHLASLIANSIADGMTAEVYLAEANGSPEAAAEAAVSWEVESADLTSDFLEGHPFTWEEIRSAVVWNLVAMFTEEAEVSA